MKNVKNKQKILSFKGLLLTGKTNFETKKTEIFIFFVSCTHACFAFCGSVMWISFLYQSLFACYSGVQITKNKN